MADVDAKSVKSKDDKKLEAKKAADKKPVKAAPAKSSSPGFFKSVMIELKKVHWPTKDKVIKYTGVVFGVVIVLGTVIWLIDTGFSSLLSLIIG